MGSLPNLHELGKNGQDSYKPGPALGHLCGGGHTSISLEEKSKILHRYSGHARIKKARSNGNYSKIIYDDFMLEHMAAYSPISSRNAIRRRDSLTSSIGATSVRRLISVVRSNINQNPTMTNRQTPYTRKLLLSNLIILCICHLMITATFLPFLALQTSVSIWTLPRTNYLKPIDISLGSILMCLTYFSASLSAIFSPSLVQKFGSNLIINLTYIIFLLFYLSHLLPSLILLIPASIVLGLSIGPLVMAQITFLMTLSVKLTNLITEEDDDLKIVRKTLVIRRLARSFQAAHDFGLILGSLLATFLITYTLNLHHSYYNTIARGASPNGENNTSDLWDYNTFLDEIFDSYEGQRLCGSQACPPNFHIFNSTEEGYGIVPNLTNITLTITYASISLIVVLTITLGLDKIRLYIYQDPLERSEGMAALRAVLHSFKDVRLQMAAPLAFFIGLEQAFIYADFSKSYVVCTLGIQRLNLVFLSMGLLQSVAACTLSMLLRSIRRYYVVAVGFTFHACLLMVLILWKPMEDDPALFYVISASWGVCNAIWEMLNFTLLTGLYSDNWQPAFANCYFFRFLGLTIAFAFHGLICNYYKLYAISFCLVICVIPFVWLEIRLENMKRVKNISRL